MGFRERVMPLVLALAYVDRTLVGNVNRLDMVSMAVVEGTLAFDWLVTAET